MYYSGFNYTCAILVSTDCGGGCVFMVKRLGEEVEQFHSVNIAARQMAKYMHAHITHMYVLYTVCQHSIIA